MADEKNVKLLEIKAELYDIMIMQQSIKTRFEELEKRKKELQKEGSELLKKETELNAEAEK